MQREKQYLCIPCANKVYSSFMEKQDLVCVLCAYEVLRFYGETGSTYALCETITSLARLPHNCGISHAGYTLLSVKFSTTT